MVRGDGDPIWCPDSTPSGVASPLPKGAGMSIHPEVLRLMRQYQMEIRPFWAQYLAERATTDGAYKRFVEQTEPARRRWEQKAKQLRERG